jgi:hypothetical protein
MPEAWELRLLGVSCRTATAAGREQFRFDPAASAALVGEAAAETPGLEAVILSSGDHTEFWLGLPAGSCVEFAWLRPLAARRPEFTAPRTGAYFYRLAGAEAAGHLFRRAAGLDADCLGDPRPAEAIEAARSLAASVGAVGRYLDHLFEQAAHLAGRVGRETNFRAVPAGTVDSTVDQDRKLAARRAAVPRVEALIAEAVEEWLASMPPAPIALRRIPPAVPSLEEAQALRVRRYGRLLRARGREPGRSRRVSADRPADAAGGELRPR